MLTCPTCHMTYFGVEPDANGAALRLHACPPAWLVWNEDNGESVADAVPIYAPSAQEAVEKWAETDDNDSAEYAIAKGQRAFVCIQRHLPDASEPEPVETYEVRGEFEPSYWATRIP